MKRTYISAQIPNGVSTEVIEELHTHGASVVNTAEGQGELAGSTLILIDPNTVPIEDLTEAINLRGGTVLDISEEEEQAEKAVEKAVEEIAEKPAKKAKAKKAKKAKKAVEETPVETGPEKPISKSEMVRRLYKVGKKVNEISKELRLRYQFVYGVVDRMKKAAMKNDEEVTE